MQWTLDELDELYDLWSTRRLADEAPPALFSRRLSEQVTGTAGGFTYLLGAAARVEASLYNSATDTDPDAVVGAAPAGPDSGLALQWRPQLTVDPAQVWLKYHAEVDIRFGAGGLAGAGVLGLDGNAVVRLASYHKHTPDEDLVPAVVSDLKAIRLPFTARQVLELEIGDATLVAASGRLGARLVLDWSDLLAAGASRLARLLDTGEVLGVRLSANASVEFDLEVTGDFRLVFSRRSADTVRVAVLKQSASSRTRAARVRVQASFARPQAVARLLREGLASMTGVSLRQIDGLIARLGAVGSLDELTPGQQKIATRLMEKLGLDSVFGAADALEARLVQLREDIESTIRDIARSRVQAGFDYEYSRLATDAALLEADLDTASLKKHHGDLLALRLAPLLSAGGSTGVSLIRFMHETTAVRRQAYGFTLGVNKWRLASGAERQQRFVTQRSDSGGMRVAMLGSYEYRVSDTLVEKAGHRWSAEFAAQTPGYSQGPVPTVNEFEFGLDLGFEFDESRTTAAEIAELVDLAQLWGVLPAGDASEQVAQIQGTVGSGKTRSRVGLTLAHSAVRSLSAFMAGLDDDSLARSLAAAMPYRGEFAGRADLNLRRSLYAPLWARLLQERSLINRPAALGLTAHRHLKVSGHAKLAVRERDTRVRRDYTLAGIAARHPRLWADFDSMRAAFGRLDAGMSLRVPYSELEAISDGIQRFCTNRYYLRAFGALIEKYRQARLAPPGSVNAVVGIDYRNGGKAMTLTVTASREA